MPPPQHPRQLAQMDERGSAATISVLVIAPILLGMLILAVTGSFTTQTDHTVASAAQNAAKLAAVCCVDAADASVAAENVALATLADNSVRCENLPLLSTANSRRFIEVVFYDANTDPTIESPLPPLDEYAAEFLGEPLGVVVNPRDNYTPAALRAQLGDIMRQGGFVRVTVYCDISLRNLTGFWLPLGNTSTRAASAVVALESGSLGSGF